MVEIGSWVPFTGNFAKTFLAIESIAFDVILLTQHYLLYPGSEAREKLESGGSESNEEQDDLLDGRKDVEPQALAARSKTRNSR